jgi:hypothetical protein
MTNAEWQMPDDKGEPRINSGICHSAFVIRHRASGIGHQALT